MPGIILAKINIDIFQMGDEALREAVSGKGKGVEVCPCDRFLLGERVVDAAIKEGAGLDRVTVL